MVKPESIFESISDKVFISVTKGNYKAYVERNPKNGKKIDVKPKKGTFFKVGKELKERVLIKM